LSGEPFFFGMTRHSRGLAALAANARRPVDVIRMVRQNDQDRRLAAPDRAGAAKTFWKKPCGAGIAGYIIKL